MHCGERADDHSSLPCVESEVDVERSKLSPVMIMQILSFVNRNWMCSSECFAERG